MRTYLAIGLIAVAISSSSCSDDPDPPLTRHLFTKNPFQPPIDALADTGQQACATYQEEACESGTLRRCSVYNTTSQSFVTPDPLTDRALKYEAWEAKYQSPDGQSTKRKFVGPTPGSMPEAEWGALAHFDSFHGLGDSAIWTGTTLNAYILRYLVTGAEVDYQRMEEKTRTLITLFDVTSIPGYLARYHYYEVPPGAPKDDRHAFFEEAQQNHTHHTMTDPQSIEGLPAEYWNGLTDSSGTVWTGTAKWNGTPTIDQYSGLTTTLPAAWALLRDEDLKGRIARQMTCYLKRLRRLELINIQSNPSAAQTVSAILDSNDTTFEPDDLDFAQLDRLVMYYLPQPNSLNVDTFDSSCPASIALTPTRIVDAASSSFEPDMFELFFDLGGKTSLRENGIDHYYVPNARGADAIHLMNLSAMAYHFTGEEMYREFFERELVENLDGVAAANTFSAVLPPKWCRKWYGSHISIAPLWGFLNLLDSSPLKTSIEKVMYDEAWLKDGSHLANAKYALMFAGTVPDSVGSGQEAAKEAAATQLREFGGNDGVLDAPRRGYSLPYDSIVSQLPAGIVPECPSEETVQQCEVGPTLFGIALDGWDITETCTGATSDCLMASGQCSTARASSALPVQLRTFWGFQWQGDPFQLGLDVASGGEEGIIQSSGVDLFESYWLARYYHAIPEAEGAVLAWEELGSCP